MNAVAKRKRGGYTIVEALMFLAISGGMFMMMTAFIGGRQARTEFQSAARNFEVELNDLANDVQNGYYSNFTSTGKKITCQANTVTVNNANGGVTVGEGTADEQGANKGCIFIGKSLQFSPSGSGLSPSNFIVHTVVGRQYAGGIPANGDALSYDASGSSTQVLYPTAPRPGVPDASETRTLGPAAEFGCVFYRTAPTSVTYPADDWCGAHTSADTVDTDVVVFMSTFGGVTPGSEDPAGSRQVDLIVPSTDKSLNRARSPGATVVNSFHDPANSARATGGLFICVQSTGSDQYAVMQLGGNSGRYSTATRINTGTCN